MTEAVLDIETRTETARQDNLNFASVVQIFLRTWPFISPSIRHLLAFVLISAVVFLTTTLLGFLIAALMNGAIVGGTPLDQLHAIIYSLDPAVFVNVERLSESARRELPWLVIWTSLPLFAIVISGGMGLYYYSIWIFQAINQRMRVRLIEQLQLQSLTFHANAKTGDAIYRVYQDSAMVASIIRYIFLEPLMYIGRYLFGLAVVAAFSPALALVLAVTVAPILYLGYRFSSPLRIAFRAAREKNSQLTSWIQESVVGIRIIKATGNERLREGAFEEHSRRAFEAAFRSRVMLAVLGILAFVAIGLAMLATQSMAAVFSHAEQSTFARNILLGFGFAIWNLGSFTAATQRANDGAGSLNAVISIWDRAQDMAVGLNRVFEILDLEPEVQDAPGASELSALNAEVSFENVSFEYVANRPVLSHVNIVTQPGSITALIGPTGTGKSTLMSLLLRLADPQSGRVAIGDQDIRDVTIDSLRRQITIATQENILFSETVSENIRYAMPDASREDVIAAAKIACADEFIGRLPQGYDTPLGERATKLSTGERQRIVIARAVVKDTPILILDEPTAALDAETELRVMRNLSRWAQDRCVFLITHRLSTIRQADRVIYLRDGCIAASGQHNELVDENEAYKSFVEAETGSDRTNWSGVDR